MTSPVGWLMSAIGTKQTGRALFMLAPTWVVNPTLPRDHEDIKEAYATDPSWAAAEYGACWRSDVESFITREALEAVVDWHTYERPYVAGLRYAGFVDPSGGSSDAMTLGITHIEDSISTLDVLREVVPPFSPEAVVNDFAAVLKEYKIKRVVGDKYGGAWVQEAFKRFGITYEPSAKPKSDLYRDAFYNPPWTLPFLRRNEVMVETAGPGD